MKFFGAALCTAAAASVGDAEAVRAMADGSSAPCMQMTSEYTQFDGPSSSKSFPSTLKNIFSKKKSSKVSPSFEEIDEFRKKIQTTTNLLKQSTSSPSVAASNWVEQADKLDDIASFTANEIGKLVKLKRYQEFEVFMGAVPSDVKAGVLYFLTTASTVEVVECTKCLFYDYAECLVISHRKLSKVLLDEVDVATEQHRIEEVRSFINTISADKIMQFSADFVTLLSEDKDAVQEVLAAKKLLSGASRLSKESRIYLNKRLEKTFEDKKSEESKKYKSELKKSLDISVSVSSKNHKKYVKKHLREILQSFLPPCRFSEDSSELWIETRKYLNACQSKRLKNDLYVACSASQLNSTALV